MTAGPGDRAAARGYAASHGYVRASDADRERVVDALKAAYVHGLLTKDELGMRTGQALGARTYGELASITAGIPTRPAGPAKVHPHPPAPKPVRLKRVVTWGACVIVPPGLAAAFLTYYGGFVVLFLLAFIGAVVTAGPVRASSRHRWHG